MGIASLFRCCLFRCCRCFGLSLGWCVLSCALRTLGGFLGSGLGNGFLSLSSGGLTLNSSLTLSGGFGGLALGGNSGGLLNLQVFGLLSDLGDLLSLKK